MTQVFYQLIIFLAAFSLSAHAADRHAACWDWFSGHSYPGMDPQGFIGELRCAALCYGHSSFNNMCQAFDIGIGGCHMKFSSAIFVYGNAIYANPTKIYALKNRCRGNNCWKKNDMKASNLKNIYAFDEYECRFLCLEYPDCWNYAYKTDGCYIQKGNIMSGADEIDGLQTLEFDCKNEACFNVAFNQGNDHLPKIDNVSTNMDCRDACLKVALCHGYVYKHLDRDCRHVYANVDHLKMEKRPGYKLYTMKEHCM